MSALLREIIKAIAKAVGQEILQRAARVAADRIERLLQELREWFEGGGPDEAAEAA